MKARTCRERTKTSSTPPQPLLAVTGRYWPLLTVADRRNTRDTIIPPRFSPYGCWRGLPGRRLWLHSFAAVPTTTTASERTHRSTPVPMTALQINQSINLSINLSTPPPAKACFPPSPLLALSASTCTDTGTSTYIITGKRTYRSDEGGAGGDEDGGEFR